MKKLISCLAMLSAFLIVFAQETPPAQLNEFVILVNPTNYLSANKLRATFPSATLDPVTGKLVNTIRIEAWGEDVDAGVTNSEIVRTHMFRITPAQSAAWASSTNGFLFLKNAMLIKTRMTERLP